MIFFILAKLSSLVQILCLVVPPESDKSSREKEDQPSQEKENPEILGKKDQPSQAKTRKIYLSKKITKQVS